jgi:uncharacterized protein YndB with AHSA1/START domain
MSRPQTTTIEREVLIDASPEIVFDVISRPEHMQQWFPDEANYELVEGATGTIRFGDPAAGGAIEPFTVVAIDYPTRFAFRWIQPPGLLVTFTLVPTDGGTLLKLVETGFHEMGWDDATIEATYTDHVAGWDQILPRLVPYIATLERRP